MIASGAVRDLGVEIAYLLDKEPDATQRFNISTSEGIQELSRIRREARIEVHRLLGEQHPATRNLEEIVIRYRTGDQLSLKEWAQEFASALAEAAQAIEGKLR
jgi:hypothetical protein